MAKTHVASAPTSVGVRLSIPRALPDALNGKSRRNIFPENRMSTPRIRALIIEDNQDITANLYAFLEPLGYELDCAHTGTAGLESARRGCFDVIMLDIMLPGLDGLSVCRALRREYAVATPILMLTARDTVADRVAGLDDGADDYLVKPFSMKELDARLRTLVRRAAGMQTQAFLQWGDLTLDPAAHTACRAGLPLKLGPTAFTILATLLRAAPRIVSRAELEHAVWGDTPPESGALRTHIHELRQKLDKPFSRPLLKTVPHVGYGLDASAAAENDVPS